MDSIIVILTIVLMECALSVDNAAALATLVKHLPDGEKRKALRYGIIGAYAFRFAAIFLASWLISVSWMKALGWAYLVYLAYSHFFGNSEESETKSVTRWFWATVATVEAMDIVFSIDNVLAAVAMTPNVWLVIGWVAVWILAMRFVAWAFVDLMERHPALESSAYLAIALLGAKLLASYVSGILGFHGAEAFLESHTASAVTSAITVLLFSLPFLQKHVSRHP